MTNSAETYEQLAEPLPYLEIEIEPGLRLKQLELQQATRLFELTDQNREYLREWLPWPDETQSVEDSTEFIQLMLDKRKHGEEYGYAIELDGQVVGHISLMHVTDERDPEIGYWIAENAQGRGAVTKSTVALTHFGLETLGLNRIIIRADPKNTGSNKVAEKSGYIFEGVVESEDDTLNVWSTNLSS